MPNLYHFVPHVPPGQAAKMPILARGTRPYTMFIKKEKELLITRIRARARTYICEFLSRGTKMDLNAAYSDNMWTVVNA